MKRLHTLVVLGCTCSQMCLVRGCRWANNLITLQPKCKIDPILIENALCIFDAYCHAAQEQVSSPHQLCSL